MLGEIWGGFVFALEQVLKYFFDLTGSAGLAIIIFTIVVKVVTLPLTIRQLRSSRDMQKLQPKVREIQKKYAKNREKLNQELMKLYKEHGVNPASGCLPLVIQLPIFFGVYAALLNLSRPLSLGSLLGRWTGFSSLAFLGLASIPENIQAGLGTLANEAFLWLSSIGRADPLHILPILAVVLQVLQQKMMSTRSGDQQQAMMSNMMMITFPLMFLIIGWNLPAGAVLYWVTQSLIGLVQQYIISGWGGLTQWFPFLPEREPAARESKPKVEALAGGEAQQPRGWFWRMMDRLTDSQRQATTQAEGDGEEGATPEAGSTPVLPPTPEKRRSRR